MHNSITPLTINLFGMTSYEASPYHPFMLNTFNGCFTDYRMDPSVPFSPYSIGHFYEDLWSQYTRDTLLFRTYGTDLNSSLGQYWEVPCIRIRFGIIPNEYQLFVLFGIGTAPGRKVKLQVFLGNELEETLELDQTGVGDYNTWVKEAHGFVVPGDGETPIEFYLEPVGQRYNFGGNNITNSYFYFYSAEWSVF